MIIKLLKFIYNNINKYITKFIKLSFNVDRFLRENTLILVEILRPNYTIYELIH